MMGMGMGIGMGIERRGFLRLALGAIGLAGTLGIPGRILERARTFIVYGSGEDGDLTLAADQVLSDVRRYEALDLGRPVSHPRLDMYVVRTLALPRALGPENSERRDS